MEGLHILRGNHPDERAEWLRLLATHRRIEAFAHPVYLDLFASHDEVSSCAVLATTAYVVMYPFLWRPLRGVIDLPAEYSEASDICAPPYGWGGPFVSPSVHHEEAVDAFYAAFTDWAQTAGIVSEYQTFCPLEGDETSYPGEVDEKLPIVIRSLHLDEEAMARDFKPKVRKNVKRAQRSGLVGEVDEEGKQLDAFLRIYYSTMDRREVEKRYYFPEAFFQTIASGLRGRYVFVHVRKGDEIVSSELALVSDRSVYSYMGGTLAHAFPDRPNDLLKDELIRWARERGCEAFILGGGSSGEDGIFRYKQSFAPSGVRPLMVGRWVVDPSAYAALVAARASRGTSAKPGYFPAYRSP